MPVFALCTANEQTRRRERLRLALQARRKLGESDDDERLSRNIKDYMDVDSGKIRPLEVDMGLFFAPFLPRGMITYGPRTVKDMWTMFVDRLKLVDPSLAPASKLPIRGMTDLLIREQRVIAVFGKDEKVNQVASLQDYRVNLKSDDIRQIKEIFTEGVEPELVRWTTYDSPRDKVSADDFFGTHLSSWRSA